MDNFTVILQNQTLVLPESGQEFKALIEELPSPLQNLKIGDNLLLRVLLSEKSSNQQTNLQVEYQPEGKNATVFPLKTILPNIDTAEISPQQIEIKVIGKRQNQAAVKIVSIDGETPEKYFKPSSTIIEKEMRPVILSTSEKNMPVLQPLKLNNILPLPERGGIISASIRLTEINIPKMEISRLENSMEEALMKVSFALENAEENISKDTLMQILHPLQNKSITGVIKEDGNGLRFIETRLGKILPEDAGIKLPVDAETVLEIVEIRAAETGQKLAEILPDFSELVKNKQPSVMLLEETPLLQKILEPLKGVANEQISRQEILQKFPALNENMLPNLVNFMKAAVNRNLNVWLGNKLVKGLEEIGEKGQKVLQSLNEMLQPPAEKNLLNWRVVEIPFYNGESLSRIRVAVRKPEDDDEQSRQTKKSAGTRFVVDTSFSKLGEFQFDGFSVAGERRFDLIVRTSRPIAEGLYADIIRLFKTSLHQVDYHGGIKINVKENFIKICDDNNQAKFLDSGVFV